MPGGPWSHKELDTIEWLILIIEVQTIDSTASPPTHLPTLCIWLCPPASTPLLKIIFLKISNDLLFYRVHTNSFLWNICNLITPFFFFPQFPRLLYLEKFWAHKKLKEYYNEQPHILHLASPVNISPHFLHPLDLTLFPPLSPSLLLSLSSDFMTF